MNGNVKTNGEANGGRKGMGWVSMLSLLMALVACGCASRKGRAVMGQPGDFRGGLAFSPDGQHLAASEISPPAAIVFDVRTRTELWRFEPVRESGSVAALAYTTNGQLLLATRAKSETEIWNASESNLVARLPAVAAAEGLAFSPDGRYLALTPTSGGLRVWEAATGHELAPMKDSEHCRFPLAFSADGQILVGCDNDRRGLLWRTATGEEAGMLPRQERRVAAFAFAPEGDQLAVSSGPVTLWAVDRKEPGQVIEPASFDAAQKTARVLLFLVAIAGGRVVPEEGPETVWHGGEGRIAFSPDGQYLAMIDSTTDWSAALVSAKHQVRIFDLDRRQPISAVAYGGGIWSVAFSPDGSLLATAGRSVEVWDWRKPGRQRVVPEVFHEVVVELKTNATPNPSSPLARMAPKKVRIEQFTDERVVGTLGERHAAFNAKMSDVFSKWPVEGTVQSAIRDLFSKCGHAIVENSPDLEVSGRVKEFRVQTPASIFKWDIKAEVEVEVRVQAPEVVHSATYTGKAAQTTAIWPGRSIIERVLNEALGQLLDNVQSDPVWNTLR